jgi:hypothetical protein
MDWQSFSQPSVLNTYKFRKETFKQLFDLMYEKVQKGDGDELVAYLLAVFEDFPEIQQMFENYFDAHSEEGDIWSNQKVILRFFKKLDIIYETLINKIERTNL